MSSSRVQTTFTGIPAAFATCTASATKSDRGFARLPNPPPRKAVWMVTCSGGTPAIFAAMVWSLVWNCVPVQISQRFPSSFTVQLSGSIGACARYGTSYSASIRFFAVASAASAVPLDLERVAPLLGAPVVRGHHRHARGHLHHRLHPGHRHGVAGVERLQRTAEDRRARDQRGAQAGELDVDPELGLAGDLLGRVQPARRFAEDLPILLVLERHRFRR